MGSKHQGGPHKSRKDMSPEELARQRELDRQRTGANDKRTEKYKEHLRKKADQQRVRLAKRPELREENRRRKADWLARMTKEQYEQYLADQRERNREQRKRQKQEQADAAQREEDIETSHYEWLLELYTTGLQNLRAVEREMAPARRQQAIRNLAEVYQELTALQERIMRRRQARAASAEEEEE